MDESNSAPRLLSRPGEGIYNDSAGAIEGNSPFQVVWLPDDERDAWLDKVVQRVFLRRNILTSVTPAPSSLKAIRRLTSQKTSCCALRLNRFQTSRLWPAASGSARPIRSRDRLKLLSRDRAAAIFSSWGNGEEASWKHARPFLWSPWRRNTQRTPQNLSSFIRPAPGRPKLCLSTRSLPRFRRKSCSFADRMSARPLRILLRS